MRKNQNLTTRERHGKECAEPISSLARALGRRPWSKDIALKHIRTNFGQGHGGSGHLYGVEILKFVGRQRRIQVGHQRGNGYLITGGIRRLKQVTNGFVYKVSADTGDNQSQCSAAGTMQWIFTYRPAPVFNSTTPWWRLSRASSSLSPPRTCDIFTRFVRCASSSECDGKRLEMGLR